MIEWFDDLALGMRFKTSEVAVTTEDIKRFAAEFDPQTGLVSRLRYETVTVTGPPSAVEEAWEDFRDVQGLKVPYRITITQNGQKFAEAKVTGYEINSGLKLQDLQKRQ